MPPQPPARPRPTPDLLLPDFLRAHPEARPVLDRYGLHGCGGRLGPYETIGFFAKVHGVDEARLLDELGEAIASPAPSAGPEAPGLADTIYRRYFLGAIALTLTAGATWGAWMLWTIGLRGSFQGTSLHQVNAHGEAQIFGWMGLFIMGFAYQAFPRLWHTTLAAPRSAAWAFGLMVAGLVLRTIGTAAAGVWPLALPLALVGGSLQVLAVATFIVQMVVTFARGGVRFEPYIGFVMGALAWFAASSVFGLWHTWNTLAARTPEELVWYVATYQSPLRDLQIHGLALFMILGVSLRMLPALFGLPRVPERRAWWALGLLVTAVLGEVGLFLAYRATGHHVYAACLVLPWTLLAAGSLMVVLPWRPWRPFPVPDRSAKFIRAAFGWLAVSLAMLLMLPVHLRFSGIPFSHAYHGAIRHAITVGFISLMIMGMAAKVVPTLRGLDPRALSPLRGPFVLVNLGCLLRVTSQTLTDWYAAAFAVIGVSGTLEVAGLAWWGFGLLVAMYRHEADADATGAPVGEAISGRIEPGHIVADILEQFPETLPVFERLGFAALRQPMLRRTLAKRVTVAQAAAFKGMSADALLDALNESISERIRPAVAPHSAVESGPM